MKIRISGNSIRFGLKQTEVKQFRDEGEIKEEILFGMLPANKLSFILTARNTNSFSISWESNQTTLQVPDSVWAEWTHTDLVGFKKDITTCKGQTINILNIKK